MTNEVELSKLETGSKTGSDAENDNEAEEKPEVEAEKEKLLNDENPTDKTSEDSVKIMASEEGHPNGVIEENDIPSKNIEDEDDDDEKVPFYKSLWFIILMSGQSL